MKIGLIHSGCVGLGIRVVGGYKNTGFNVAVALIFEKLKSCNQELFEVKRVGCERWFGLIAL
jgi:hypothetical protein